MQETASHNRNYKDSVFVDLFSTDEKAKERFLSLYNALHQKQLTDSAVLKNIKLDQVMYMSFANDVSYLVENKIIVLAEHQSTINPNMPCPTKYFRVFCWTTSLPSANSLLISSTDIPVRSEYAF